MNRFIANHADRISGVLSGFDRLVFRGTLRPISFVDGLKRLLWKNNVLLKDFGPYAQRLTTQLREASLRSAHELRRPVQYLRSADIDKEAVARQIMERDGITSGLICVLTAIEPCTSFEVYRNRDAKRLELVSRFRKGLTLYHSVAFGIYVGFAAALVSFLVGTFSPFIEYWADNLPDKRLAAMGVVVMLLGMLLQTIQYLLVLADIPVR